MGIENTNKWDIILKYLNTGVVAVEMVRVELIKNSIGRSGRYLGVERARGEWEK